MSERISSQQAAKLYGVTNDYVARLCRRGKLVGVLEGHTWMIDPKSLENFFGNRAVPVPDSTLLTSREAARVYRVTNDYIARLCRQGKLKGIFANGIWRVERSSLDTFFAPRRDAVVAKPEKVVTPVALPTVQPVTKKVFSPVVFAEKTLPSNNKFAFAAGVLALIVFANAAAFVGTTFQTQTPAAVASLESPFFSGGIISKIISALFGPKDEEEEETQLATTNYRADVYPSARAPVASAEPVQKIYQTIGSTDTDSIPTDVLLVMLGELQSSVRREINRSLGSVFDLDFFSSTNSGSSDGLALSDLTDANIPDTITASNYLLLTGGTLSGALTGTTAEFSGAATTSALTVTGLVSCSEALETNALGQIVCGTDATGAGGGTFPFTPVGYGNATSTTIGFTNGLLSTASSTFTSTLFLSSLSNSGLAVNSAGQIYAAATTTFSGGLTYSNGNVTADLGATVDLASAEVTGDLPFSSLAQISAGTVLANPTAATADAQAVSTSTLFGAGITPGYVLAFSNGIWTPTATATCAQITGSADLCDGSDATGTGAAFPFTPAAWGNSTSTTIGFTNGIISNASSTFSSTLFLTSLSNSGLAVNSAGQVYAAATTTFSGGLSYANGNVTDVITAGDGLTRTTNDIDCDIANSSTFGCLAAADWTTFNNKISSSSLSQIFPFTPTALGNSTSTLIQFTAGLIANASSTITALNSINSTSTNATTTSFAISNISSGNLLKTTTGGSITSAVAGTDYATPSQVIGAFPFTVQSWGNATGTTIGFQNGLISNASSTFSSTLFLTSLTNSGLAVNSSGQVYTAATTTYSGALTYANGNVTCNTASGSQAGCLSTTDWTTFNNKVSSSSLSSIFPFTPTTAFGTAANATSTLIGFTAGLYSLASSTIGDGTAAGGLTINGGATTTGMLKALTKTLLGAATTTSISQNTIVVGDIAIVKSGNGTTNYSSFTYSSTSDAFTVKGLTTFQEPDFFDVLGYQNSDMFTFGVSEIFSEGGTYNRGGDAVSISDSVYYSSTNGTWTGSTLDVRRFLGTLSSTLNVTGAVAQISDGCDQISGTCTSSADVLRLSQTFAPNTGTVLNITSSSTNAALFRANDDGSYADPTPFVIDTEGRVGVGTTTPFAYLSIHAASTTGLNAPKTLFAIGSSTAGTATTTLFSVGNNGSTTLASTFGTCSGTNALTTNSSGTIVCGAVSATGDGVGTWFTPTTNFGAATQATSSVVWFQNGLQASSTAQLSNLNQWGTINFATTSTSTLARIQGVNFISATSTTNGLLTIGYNAGGKLLATTTTAGQTIIGYNALGTATTSVGNTAIGYQSMYWDATTLIPYSGSNNTAVGYNSMRSLNISGSNNVALGASALSPGSTISGSNNIALGRATMTGGTVSGSNNVALGNSVNAGSTLSGSSNIGIGNSVYVGFVSGSDNIGIGTAAFNGGNVSGNGNIGIGDCVYCGYTVTGSDNVAIGSGAGIGVDVGSLNVLLGSYAGQRATDGSANIAIGYNTILPSDTADRQLNIGNLIFGTLPTTTSHTESLRLPTTGAIGIGSTTPYALLSVHANDGWGNGTASTTLFSIASSTASATTTLFSIGNTGSTTIGNFGSCSGSSALTTNSSGTIVCGAVSATGDGVGNWFPASTFGSSASNATSSLIGFTAGLYSLASSTIGGGTQTTGLTINGGATTTGNLFVQGNATTTMLGVTGNLILTGSGKAGIGAHPIYRFQVSGSGNSAVNISDADTNLGAILYVNDIQTTAGNGGEIRFGASATNRGFASIKSLISDGSGNHTGDLAFGIRKSTSDTFLSEVMRITNGGNLGLGTSSPWGALSVNNFNGGTEPLFVIASSTGTGATSTAFMIGSNGSTTLASTFGTCSGSSALTTNSSGTIVCGAVSATGDGVGTLFTPTTNFGAAANSTSTPIWFTAGLQASSTSQFANANFNGIVGVGTTTPYALLSVQATSTSVLQNLFTISSTTAAGVTSTHFNVTNTGNVGIGTANPWGKLAVSASTATQTWSQVGSSTSITPIVFPALAALSPNRVAFMDSTNDQLRTYEWNGTNWVQVGSGLSIGGGSTPSLAALSPNRVAFIDFVGLTLSTYEWNGSTWAQVGIGLSNISTGNHALAALSPNRIAFIDSGTKNLRTYEFNGTNWMQIGNSLNIASIGQPAIAVLSPNRVAFIDDTNDELRTYQWDGTNWVQIGSGISIAGAGNLNLTALSHNRVVFMDGTLDSLRTYEWNGSNWAQVGSALSFSVSFPVPAALSPNRIAFVDQLNDELRTYQFGSPLLYVAGVNDENYLSVSDSGYTTAEALGIRTTLNVGQSATSTWATSTPALIVNGNSTFSGRVGIGTTSPMAQLTVLANNTSTSSLLFLVASTTSTGLATTTSSHFVVNSAGNVGVGTSTPQAKLDVDGQLWIEVSGGGALPAAAGKGLKIEYAEISGIEAGIIQAYDYGVAVAKNLALQSVGGNVGIGTSTPQWLLNPYSATAAQLSLSAGAGVAQWAFRNAGGNLYLATTTVAGTATTTTSALTINGTTGAVGIGINDPDSTHRLVLKTPSAGSDVFLAYNSTGNILFNFLADGSDNGKWEIYDASENKDIQIATNEDTYFNGNGNFGIGETSPWSTLTVASTTAGSKTYPLVLANRSTSINTEVALRLAPSGNPDIRYNEISAINANGNNAIDTIFTTAFGSTITEKMRITSLGNVGIGTTSPWGKLSVTNEGTGPSFVVEDSTSPDTTPFIVDASGNVGIGTSTPGQKLEIYQGSIQLDNNQYIKSRLSTGLAVNILGYNSSNATIIGANSEIALAGSITLQPNSTADTIINIDSDTDLKVGTDNLWVVGATDSVGVGTTSPWARLSVDTTGIAGIQPLFTVGSSTRTDFLITQDGRVAIGTTTPSGMDVFSKFSVNSTDRAHINLYAPSGSSGAVGDFRIGANDGTVGSYKNWDISFRTDTFGGGVGSLSFYGDHATAGSKLGLSMVPDSTNNPFLYVPGNVGFGTTSAGNSVTKLNVAGAHSQLQFTDTDDNTFAHLSYSGSFLGVRINSYSATPSLSVTSSAVGIADNTPTEGTLTVGGTLYVLTNTAVGADPLCWDGSGGSLYGDCTSLSQYKDNQTDLSLGLEAVLAMQPREFDWIADMGGEHDLGFVAEELEAVSPLLVRYDNASGTLQGVKYERLTALLTKAIQEMNLNLETIASSTNASSTPQSESFAERFMSGIFARVTTWLADAGNGIADLFATTIHAEVVLAQKVQTDELCVGSVCVTEQQFLNMVQGSGSSSPEPEPTPEPEPVPQTESEPAPEPESQPTTEGGVEGESASTEEPALEESPEPEPTPEPEVQESTPADTSDEGAPVTE